MQGGSRHDAGHHNIPTGIRDRTDLMDRSIRSLRLCRFTFSILRFTKTQLFKRQAYALYLRIFYASDSLRQRNLKAEILTTKKQLLQTSAQDEFAKWAKLRRKVDKGLSDLDTLSSASLFRSRAVG